MNLELTDKQTEALVRGLRKLIDDDRYLPSPRLAPLKEILAKLRPEPERQPLPPRREPATEIERDWRFDFRATYLRNVLLKQFQLQRANLSEAHLERASLVGVHLEHQFVPSRQGKRNLS